MKKGMKKLVVLLMVMLMVILAGCQEMGVIKSETDATGAMTAHLWARKADGKTQYCLSLLGKDEVLDEQSEPNIHKSPYKFDFEWQEDILGVIQNEKEEPVVDFLEFGDITVVFGRLVPLK